MKEKKEPNMGHSGLKKEFCKTRAQIFTNDYGKSPAKMMKFAEIAKKDFPDLDLEHISIITFGGISKKYIVGIRFTIPKNNEVPGDYFQWSDPQRMDETI